MNLTGILSPIPLFKFTYKQQNFIALVIQSDITHHTLAVCREVVKYLINEQHCDPFTNDNVDSTLLHYACSSGYFDIFRYLISIQGML